MYSISLGHQDRAINVMLKVDYKRGLIPDGENTL